MLPTTAPRRVQETWVFLVFIASGFASLLYQVLWQRALFAIFGINIESVTVVVTAFMLGLGVGSLAGGILSRKPTRAFLLLFAALEACIGVFGLFSLRLFEILGDWSLSLSSLNTAVVTFSVVLIPTTLMGATLPLLVTYVVSLSGNVGRSVSLLYFVNTLGASVASVLAVLWLLPRFGLSDTARVACGINFTVALIAAAAHWSRNRT
jgi:spermidine synthase